MRHLETTRSGRRPLVLLGLLLLALVLTLGFVPQASQTPAPTKAMPEALLTPADPPPAAQVRVRMEPPAPAGPPPAASLPEDSPVGDAARLAALARLQGTLELQFADYLAAIERAEQALSRRKAELVHQREVLLAEIARVRASASLG